MHQLRAPLTFEQRRGVEVLVRARWAMIAVLGGVLFFPVNSNVFMICVVASAIVVVAAANGLLHWRLRHHQPLSVAGPLVLGVLDAVAITGAIAAIDGFDNTAYVLYFPALMSFSAIFPGRISLTYSGGIIATYTLLSVTIYRRFDRTTADDWHDLGLRVSSMVVTVVLGYLLVRVERLRRMRAVDAERDRQQQLFALEERTRELQRDAELERTYLMREIHDGVSQGLYMISLGLEGVAEQAEGAPNSSGLGPRLRALHQVSKQTLLDARGLLLELNQEPTGELAATDLMERQVEEFRAVTGLSATFAVQGESRLIRTAAATSLHRVLQESLANVYRHSGAHHVEVTLVFGSGSATLCVTDDGSGPATGVYRQGHGLRSMSERAASCGGNFDISRTRVGGTGLTFTVPLKGVGE